jgi:hypothetical protein
MLPVSTTQPVRFTPPGCEGEGAPVYLIEVPSVLTRPLFYRTLVERGVSLPPDSELRAALEDGIREVIEPWQQEELLAVSAAYWDAIAADPAGVPDEARQRYFDMTRQLAPLLPEVRRISAAQTYFFELLPVVACECFLKGAENSPVEFKLAGGMLSRSTLTALPPGHVTAVGNKALELMNLSRDQEKNSESPSPSPSSPATSTAGPSRKSKGTSGTSSATATPPTPGSS